MALGPGKFDAECTLVREKTGATSVLLVVFDGDRGAGFACQASPAILLRLPQILRSIANDIDEDRIRL